MYCYHLQGAVNGETVPPPIVTSNIVQSVQQESFQVSRCLFVYYLPLLDLIDNACTVGHILFYYSTIAPFYHIRAKEHAKYVTLLHCRTGQKYGLKAEQQNGRTKVYFLVE